MTGLDDPRLLYAVHGVKAFHLEQGAEVALTPSGPQTLSLLMVPTSAGLSEGPPQQDFYLHLHLPPELDLPLPATTQIYHQPPSSYLLPRWDLSPGSHAFTRLEFPAIGSRNGVQDDIDTFETILAQCTSFHDRTALSSTPSTPAAAPSSSTMPTDSKSSTIGLAPILSPRAQSRASSRQGSTRATDPVDEELPPYNPAEYAPGQAYVQGSHRSLQSAEGKIVLVHEEDGSVLGELGDGFQVLVDGAIKPGSKEPVEITLPVDGKTGITVQPASREYVEMEIHPAFEKSSLVSAARKASRLVMTSSDMIVSALQGQAETFVRKSQAADKPVTFNPTVRGHIRRINHFSTKAADLSASTVKTINHMAQSVGAKLGQRMHPRDLGEHGRQPDGYRPGLLNKSLMAFNTIADGIEQAGRSLLTGTSSTVAGVVEHRWGPEAGEVSRHMTDGFKNVALVYIDVTGVSRRAILRGVAKGMVVGRVANGGGNIVVGAGDGGTVDLRPTTDPIVGGDMKKGTVKG